MGRRLNNRPDIALSIVRTVIINEDLTESVDRHLANGYRLEMIMPADSPREAVLSKDGEQLRFTAQKRPPQGGTQNGWVIGRAGMMYRDVLPDRLGGKLVASHIRLTEGGPVADYVHYHKIAFQMIYCLRGRIRVVYQDQGKPFWLESGDCVLQPPEIRHRVLESEAGSEVFELSSPAEHETWLDHEMSLPTKKIDSARNFRGQTFLRHIAKEASWQIEAPVEYRNLGISAATRGLVDARVIRSADVFTVNSSRNSAKLSVILNRKGELKPDEKIEELSCFVLTAASEESAKVAPNSEILQLSISRRVLDI